jgi:SAM-dependent methyltransferase
MGERSGQYATDANLEARQHVWRTSRRVPGFSLYSWVIGLARLQGHEAVLDVGCGNGFYLELVDAVGLDRSLGMLQAARTRTAGPLVAGDAMHLPFAPAAFDVVLAPHMLYHVADRPLAVKELRRVLKPEGVLIAVTNGADNNAELVHLVEQAVGGGWVWRRPSDVAFSLQNGREQLRVGFDRVDLVPCPSGTVYVTDAEALAAYVGSVGDIYQAEIDRGWDEVVATCAARAAEIIEAEGAFRISTSVGAFVCR